MVHGAVGERFHPPLFLKGNVIIANPTGHTGLSEGEE